MWLSLWGQLSWAAQFGVGSLWVWGIKTIPRGNLQIYRDRFFVSWVVPDFQPSWRWYTYVCISIMPMRIGMNSAFLGCQLWDWFICFCFCKMEKERFISYLFRCSVQGIRVFFVGWRRGPNGNWSIYISSWSKLLSFACKIDLANAVIFLREMNKFIDQELLQLWDNASFLHTRMNSTKKINHLLIRMWSKAVETVCKAWRKSGSRKPKSDESSWLDFIDALLLCKMDRMMHIN